MTLEREGRLESCAELFGLGFLSMDENTFPFHKPLKHTGYSCTGTTGHITLLADKRPSSGDEGVSEDGCKNQRGIR